MPSRERAQTLKGLLGQRDAKDHPEVATLPLPLADAERPLRRQLVEQVLRLDAEGAAIVVADELEMAVADEDVKNLPVAGGDGRDLHCGIHSGKVELAVSHGAYLLSVDYFAFVRPTYLENWPDTLRALTVDQVDLPLTRDEALRLGSNIQELFEMFEQWVAPGQPVADILARLEAAVATFPKGAFIRLGSRSPKDAYLVHAKGNRAFTGQAALDLLTDCSERIADDLLLALTNDYEPHVFARRFVEIPAWAEFRCFMQAGELVGISQYDYRVLHPEVATQAGEIEAAVKTFFPRFRDAAHLDDAVFDVFLEDGQAHLLEVNPFFSFTDPCLYDWAEGFDGRFRYLK